MNSALCARSERGPHASPLVAQRLAQRWDNTEWSTWRGSRASASSTHRRASVGRADSAREKPIWPVSENP
eukprot:8260099-Pyramimonas_sp.AAC.1